MFKLLVKELFPSLNRGEFIPDYMSFERSRTALHEDDATEQQKQESTTSNLQSGAPKRFPELPFFDYLFGDSSQSVEQDNLSEYVAHVLSKVIARPEKLLAGLPVMPTSVTTVISLLGNQNFNVSELLKVVEQEASMAADLVKLANSSRYKRGETDVTDLHRAFMYIGADGLRRGVVETYLKQYAPSPSLYFKRFGQKIWNHSVNSAQIAQSLALKVLSKDEANTVYFVALLRNLGAMVIFQLMVDAFKFVDPDTQPNSSHFKQIMAQDSLSLVISIAEYWQLPKSVNDLLQQIHTSSSAMSPSAMSVYDADIISKGKSLLDAKRWTQEQFIEQMSSQLVSEQGLLFAQDLLPQKRSHD